MTNDLEEFLDFFSEEGQSTPTPTRARPVIKWVGGKTQLLGLIFDTLPEKIETYYEPFIGGAAVFLALASEGRFKRARLNDWNPELVNLYTVVRHQPEELMHLLDYWRDLYEADPKRVYADIREDDRADGPGLPEDVAARTIFLNKAGFNGVYRQNKSGKFNVPWGKKPKVNFYDRENMLACAKALMTVERFTVGDFAPAVTDAGPGDVVYMDPPYIPHSVTSNFTSYTSDGFNMDDQKRVAETARQLVKQGAHVVVSNNDVPPIYDLYVGFEIRQVQARRNVNSKGDKRGAVGEVLIVGKP